MLEKKVIEKLKKFFKKKDPDCFFRKMHMARLHGRGFPDLVVISASFVYFLEVKAPGKKLTKIQRATLIQMAEASLGGPNQVYVQWVRPNKACTQFEFRNPKTDEIEFTKDVD